MWRDHGLTASPNAGWSMSAAAGALGVQLEKVEHYRLNAAGRLPEAGDVARAAALSQRALLLATPLLVGAVAWRGRAGAQTKDERRIPAHRIRLSSFILRASSLTSRVVSCAPTQRGERHAG
jgi:hypothetical protein